MKSISGEPVCLWLPKHLIPEGTSEYVQGVEVPMDYDGQIPEGFDIIELPKCKYMMFQGEPFEEETLVKQLSRYGMQTEEGIVQVSLEEAAKYKKIHISWNKKR